MRDIWRVKNQSLASSGYCRPRGPRPAPPSPSTTLRVPRPGGGSIRRTRLPVPRELLGNEEATNFFSISKEPSRVDSRSRASTVMEEEIFLADGSHVGAGAPSSLTTSCNGSSVERGCCAVGTGTWPNNLVDDGGTSSVPSASTSPPAGRAGAGGGKNGDTPRLGAEQGAAGAGGAIAKQDHGGRLLLRDDVGCSRSPSVASEATEIRSVDEEHSLEASPVTPSERRIVQLEDAPETSARARRSLDVLMSSSSSSSSRLDPPHRAGGSRLQVATTTPYFDHDAPRRSCSASDDPSNRSNGSEQSKQKPLPHGEAPSPFRREGPSLTEKFFPPFRPGIFLWGRIKEGHADGHTDTLDTDLFAALHEDSSLEDHCARQSRTCLSRGEDSSIKMSPSSGGLKHHTKLRSSSNSLFNRCLTGPLDLGIMSSCSGDEDGARSSAKFFGTPLLGDEPANQKMFASAPCDEGRSLTVRRRAGPRQDDLGRRRHLLQQPGVRNYKMF